MKNELLRRIAPEERGLSRLIPYVRLALSLPIREAADRFLKLVVGKWRVYRERRSPTYVPKVPFASNGLHSYVPMIPSRSLGPHAKLIFALAIHYLDHRFNLLGSGWVRVEYGMRCAGIENYLYGPDPSFLEDGACTAGFADRVNEANRLEAARIRELIDSDYQPIDWHVDFKSGYRWQEDRYYKAVRYGHRRGADVKVPWELARMQHLTMLAWAYGLHADGSHEKSTEQGSLGSTGHSRDAYAREFRNQILDFVASNPPRFGVNWVCTMDTAIRAANWLLAYDLFTAYGARFDPEFIAVFVRTLYEHGLHIVNNLEYSRGFRGNHYLADIVGLVFVSAYLPRNPETDAWLAFAVQELLSEIPRQFLPDGLNFEASVPYHRLSLEMVTYATALVLGLHKDKVEALKDYDHRALKVKPALRPGPIRFYALPDGDGESPFPPDYFRQLEKSAQATLNTMTSDGHVPQIGDNDNGRLFKVHPVYRAMTVADAEALYENLPKSPDMDREATYLDEDHLDHSHLLSGFGGLYGSDFPGSEKGISFEAELVGGLAGGSPLKWTGRLSQSLVFTDEGSDDPPASAEVRHEAVAEHSVSSEIPKGGSLTDSLTSHAHPDFGVYLFRSPRLHLSVRCGPNGQCGRGGHAHNDQLSLELSIDQIPILIDAGTYSYTSLIDKRNLFRSTGMHNTLAVDEQEQNEWLDGNPGVFRLSDRSRAETEHVSVGSFVGRHFGFGPCHRRSITIRNNGIEGSDELASSEMKTVNFHLSPEIVIGTVDIEEGIEIRRHDLLLSFRGGPGSWSVKESWYSPAYGALMRNRVLCLQSKIKFLRWSITLS